MPNEVPDSAVLPDISSHSLWGKIGKPHPDFNWSLHLYTLSFLHTLTSHVLLPWNGNSPLPWRGQDRAPPSRPPPLQSRARQRQPTQPERLPSSRHPFHRPGHSWDSTWRKPAREAWAPTPSSSTRAPGDRATESPSDPSAPWQRRPPSPGLRRGRRAEPGGVPCLREVALLAGTRCGRGTVPNPLLNPLCRHLRQRRVSAIRLTSSQLMSRKSTRAPKTQTRYFWPLLSTSPGNSTLVWSRGSYWQPRLGWAKAWHLTIVGSPSQGFARSITYRAFYVHI